MTAEKTFISGTIGYNRTQQRYGLLDSSDLWIVAGFHCGERLEIKSECGWIPTRMEMDSKQQWYLVDTEFRGRELEGLQARISKDS